jgi:predicted transcriptional regulator
MLLSFKPNVYKKIYEGVKIFEHRRNFPNEPIMAYMYVSKPVRAITGIVYLSNRHELIDWERQFSYDSQAIQRIEEYKKSYRYAMEIVEFQETNKISLDDLKRDLPNFVVPQSYIYLDNNTELLKYIDEKIVELGKNIKHDFSIITSNQICVH